MRRILPAACAVVLMALPVESAEISAEASTALVELNSKFIEAHAAAKQLDLAAGPIVLLRDGELVLIRHGAETAVPVIFPEYQTFKAFAHLPVAIYLMLGPPGEGKVDAKRLEQLRDYLGRMERVEKSIEQIGLADGHLERQKKIVTQSKDFLNRSVQQQQISTSELYAFTRSMTPLIKENLAGAAASQLDAMHRQMMAWKSELTAEEWKQLRIVLLGAVLAREGNLAKQYFSRLLHIEGEGPRLVYMERYFPPTPMLTLLATRSVDQRISIAFFEDPERMFRDVLQDAAAAHIKKLNFDE
jgi:hypothetical protein